MDDSDKKIIVLVLISIVSAFVLQTEGVTKSLAARDDFVMFLFTLMSNKKVFLQTATLIEDILSVRKVMKSIYLDRCMLFNLIRLLSLWPF